MMGNFYQKFEMPQKPFFVHRQANNKAEVIELHSHTFYEIIYCISGNMQYILDGKRFQILPGDVLLIPPGKSHRPLFPKEFDTPYERIIIFIDYEFWKDISSKYPNINFSFEQCKKRDNYLLRTSTATSNGLYAGFKNALDEAQSDRFGNEVTVPFSVILLMLHISRTYYYLDIASPEAENDSFIDNIIYYIDANLDKKISLDSFACQFLVSKSTVSRLFKQKLDVPFYKFVLQRRLIAAKNYILSGEPLNKVWEKCGFSDYSSFYKAFKKEYGISPKEFKNLNIK